MDATENVRFSKPNVNLTGMMIFLASEIFLFGSLFFSYFYLKINTQVWPPSGVHLDNSLAIANTAILLSSSAVVWLATKLIQKGKTRWSAIALLGTSLMGAAFLGITIWEWTHETFQPWNSAYGSIFFTLTGFHALHILGGAMLMLALGIRTLKGCYSADKHSAVEIGSLYWHYVDAIWILVFITLFLVR
jgi:heme/copper-type cytochrome/quinol oxidase subunit 3